MNKLPLAKTEEQRELWKRLQPVNRVAATDTYKRTMSGSSAIFSERAAVYTLVARKALKEENMNGRYIMAGLEKMLYPWFANPITKKEIEKAKKFFTSTAVVAKFPQYAWEAVLRNQGQMPVDIYALPGGQTFLAKDGKHVPIMSVEGKGALVSHLEPHLEGIYAPIIQATKARLMKEEVGQQFAEFGLRADENENNHVTLMLALYVGGKFSLTSDDHAVLLFPEYFKDIGTIGHEFIMAYQREGISLEETQEKAFRDFVTANQRSALLPDVINTLYSGLPAILKLVQEYQDTEKVIMPRFDSGDVAAQCIYWKKMTLAAGITETKMVVEDGYTPAKARETKQRYARAGFNPDNIIVGAGGYFRQGCTRDAASLVYKRSATEYDGKLEASLKFSDSPGKESIPGRIRIYEQDSKLIVAQESEKICGKPLMVKVV
ncbi:MAG: nicotinamide phosphoribosyltransferase domain-containing protein, partial [Nanoarchaeota archaeon]